MTFIRGGMADMAGMSGMSGMNSELAQSPTGNGLIHHEYGDALRPIRERPPGRASGIGLKTLAALASQKGVGLGIATRIVKSVAAL